MKVWVRGADKIPVGVPAIWNSLMWLLRSKFVKTSTKTWGLKHTYDLLFKDVLVIVAGGQPGQNQVTKFMILNSEKFTLALYFLSTFNHVRVAQFSHQHFLFRKLSCQS